MKKILNSFKYAVRGIIFTFKNEGNFRLMIYIGILAIILSVYFNIKTWEKILVYFLVALVLILELINTAIERIANEINKNFSENIKHAKDTMAGAVLITSILALIIGLMIFLKYFKM